MSVQDLRMLFVDDNPNWLNSVVAGLTSQKVEERGWKIDRAYTVEEALEKLAAGPYALLLCDLDFFGEPRGLAVLRAALEDPKAPTYQPDICAIVLTAVGEFGALLKAYELGAFHFVSKDFGTGKDLLQAIIHLIEKGLEWRRGRVEENEFHKCFQQCAATRNEKTDAKAVATEVVKSLGRILGDPWSIQVATFVQNRWEVLTKTEEGPKLPSESIAGLIKDKRALLDKVSWSAYPIEVDKVIWPAESLCTTRDED